MPLPILLLLLLLVALVRPAQPALVTVSNTAVRRTALGSPVLAQDGNLVNALSPAGDFLLLGMSYGLCAYTGCANETLGACGFGAGRILLYASPSLANGSWSEPVELLPAAQRPGNAIYFRPHLVRNPATGQWVLWVRYLPYRSPSLAQDATLYLVAAAAAPEGPYAIVNHNVTMFWPNSADDNLYVAPDGAGYIVHTARSTGTRLVVERLAPDYFSSAGARDAGARSAPIGAGGMEAPALWSTGPGEWWVSGAPLCCYCSAGAATQVFFSSSGPLGPYTPAGALGNAPRGQQNFVFAHARLPGQLLVAFNRWGSDPTGGPAPLFDLSLQYWATLSRQGGGWAPLVWQDEVTLNVTDA
jgi:hypothetical protein